MDPIVQFRILGPLEVRVAGGPARITAPREQATLAALLLHPGTVVSVEQLVSVVWDDRPPAGPANQVAICISSLRRKLTAAGAPDDLIATVPPGYLLREEHCDLDIDQVEVHASEARRLTAAGRLHEAAGRLRSALDLWRGPVLAGISSRSLQPEIVRWQERRLAIAGQFAQLELDLGHAHDIIGELSATVADQPLREGPRGQLMVALHQVGRTAEALEVYGDLRGVLRAELGIDPGPDLRALHEAILRGTIRARVPRPPGPESTATNGRARPSGRAAEPSHPGTLGRAPVTLPTDVADFTGRAVEVDALSAALVGARGTAVPVVLVCGAAGVGKTALAVHTAHRLAAEFPDGQLYVDLHGLQGEPADPTEVLGWFLRALGVNGQSIPEGAERRAELYRALLSDRRVLVLLDNAATEAQVESLLPGSPTCGVLVTSRIRLTGLAGARLMELTGFRPDQAVALLRAIIGDERVDGEPEAAVALVRYCGSLPLAVRIVGARLSAKPHWTLTRLVGQLECERGRLNELTHGTLSVRASLSLSYQAVPLAPRRLLCRLGLLDAPDFTAAQGIAQLGTDESRAAEAFEMLVDAQLVEVAAAGPGDEVRYRLHDLVRLFARERAREDESMSLAVTSGRHGTNIESIVPAASVGP